MFYILKKPLRSEAAVSVAQGELKPAGKKKHDSQ